MNESKIISMEWICVCVYAIRLVQNKPKICFTIVLPKMAKNHSQYKIEWHFRANKKIIRGFFDSAYIVKEFAHFKTNQSHIDHSNLAGINPHCIRASRGHKELIRHLWLHHSLFSRLSVWFFFSFSTILICEFEYVSQESRWKRDNNLQK